MAHSKDSIVVELGGKQNQYFIVKFLEARLRGRWSVANETESARRTGARNMPDIPGMHIVIDRHQRVIRAFDPLGTAKYREVLDRANAIRRPFFGEGRPHDDLVIRNATDDELKTALWEMRERVDDNKARVVSGNLPDRQSILKMDGRLRVRYGTLPVSDTGETMSPYATDEELEKLELGASAAKRVVSEAAGS